MLVGYGSLIYMKLAKMGLARVNVARLVLRIWASVAFMMSKGGLLTVGWAVDGSRRFSDRREPVKSIRTSPDCCSPPRKSCLDFFFCTPLMPSANKVSERSRLDAFPIFALGFCLRRLSVEEAAVEVRSDIINTDANKN